MTLHEFLTRNLDVVLASVRKKFLEGRDRGAVADQDDQRLELFLRQLIATLQSEVIDPASANKEIRESAASHGADLLRQGFTVAQVIHGYGSVCQAVTELAVELNATITPSEFRTLNQCLDAAIAESVTEYGRQRDLSISNRRIEHLGSLAHELRNLLSSAMLAFEIIEKGQVGISGSTGGVLGRSLLGLRNLVDRTLSEVRLDAGIQRRKEVRVAELVEEVEASASMEATGRDVNLVVTPGPYDVLVDVDRHLMASAISNLVQNAIKFTRPKGLVRVVVELVGDRVSIAVTDECGGLPVGTMEELFRPYGEVHAENGGIGLGLAVARRSVEANGGVLHVRDLPGQGCVFTIELPVARQASGALP